MQSDTVGGRQRRGCTVVPCTEGIDNPFEIHNRNDNAVRVGRRQVDHQPATSRSCCALKPAHSTGLNIVLVDL